MNDEIRTGRADDPCDQIRILNLPSLPPPMSVPPTPLTPGTRKHKVPPALPLSVFAPPSTGTADRFPFPPSPTSVSAESVVDASVVVSSADLGQWNSEATAELKTKVSGVVLLVKADDAHQLVEKYVSDQSSATL